MSDDLTEYERDLAERFRSDLFDNEQSWGTESIIDPANPMYSAVLAIALPPRKKRPRKVKKPVSLKQEYFDA